MSNTPRTDDATGHCVCNATPETDVVPRNLAKELERQNEQLKKSVQTAGHEQLLKHTPKTKDGEYIYLGMTVFYIEPDYGNEILSGVIDSIYVQNTDGHSDAMAIVADGSYEGGNLEFWAKRENCPNVDS